MKREILREAKRLGLAVEKAEYVRGGWGEGCPGMWMVEVKTEDPKDGVICEYSASDVLTELREIEAESSQNVEA